MSHIVLWALLGCLAAAVAGLVVSRRRIAAELVSVNSRFKGYMDHGPFLAFMKDAEGRYTYENLALAEHIARIRPGISTCVGRTDRELFPAAEELSYVGNDTLVMDSGHALRFLEKSVDADGTVRHWSTVKFPRWDAEGRAFIAGISIDVSERQASFERLDRQKAVLRRLIEVQESERRMLCHELHDGLLQYAIGSVMLLESAKDSADVADQSARIAAALECLGRGIAEGRQVIRGVRTAVLDDLGLTAAIHDLADQMLSFGIRVDLDLHADLDSTAPALLTTVYRVVQESLSNVRKHAGADCAVVIIRREASHVDIFVSDTGKGFDVADAKTRGFGLEGMAERVLVVGGECTIDSRPGSGTRIHVRLVNPEDGSAEPHVASRRRETEAGCQAQPALPS